MTDLLVQIERGQCSDRTSLLDCRLSTLIREMSVR